MNKIKLARWIGVAVFGMMAIYALSEKGFFGALLLLLGGVLIAPIGIISKLCSKLKLNEVVSVVLAGVLLFTGVLITPTSDISNDTSNDLTILEAPSDDDTSSQITEPSSNNDSSTEDTSIIDDTTSTEDTSSTIGTDSKEDTTSKPTTTTKPKDNNSKPTESQNTTCSHTNTSIKNKVNATCTEEGYTGDTYCNSCNKVIKNGSQIKATGHSTEIRNKKSATTTSEGYTGDTYCKTCNAKIKSGETIPKIKEDTQHNNSQKVYITATGTKYHSTKNCSGLNNAKAIYDSTLSEAQNKGLKPCSKCY